MLNFKTQKYIFQIQKLVKMVKAMVRVTAKAMETMATWTEINKMVRISTTIINPVAHWDRMESMRTIRQETVEVPEMHMVTEVEDQTVHHEAITGHQGVKIIPQIEVQIGIQNMEIPKTVMVPQPGR